MENGEISEEKEKWRINRGVKYMGYKALLIKMLDKLDNEKIYCAQGLQDDGTDIHYLVKIEKI